MKKILTFSILTIVLVSTQLAACNTDSNTTDVDKEVCKTKIVRGKKVQECKPSSEWKGCKYDPIVRPW